MSIAETEGAHSLAEDAGVFLWRFLRSLEMGFGTRLADRIAGTQIDLHELGEKTVAYWYFIKFFPTRYKNALFAYKYVGWALVGLGAFFVTSIWWTETPEWARWIIVFLPMYRLWDIIRWWVDLLIDRRHYSVVSRERNVVFLALNLLEIIFIGAILFRAAGMPGSLSGSWFDSFFLVTQLSFPSKDTAFWQQLAKMIIEASSLVLLLGGLSALVDLIGRKLKEDEWHGPE
jgi:hypothetical protein